MKSNILVKKQNNQNQSQKSNSSKSFQRIANQSTDSLINLAKNRKFLSKL